MLLSDVEGYVRQDLFDPAGANQRWATGDIDRAIDKAVERYSQYYPNIVFADMNTQPFQRTYPYPVPWNAAYPVWWIERVLYPLQSYGSYFNPPAAPSLALLVQAGGNLAVGTYGYAITFLSQGGESTPSPLASINQSNGLNAKISITNIPIGQNTVSTPGVATNTVIGRNIYRTTANGSTLYLLATIADNITTSYIDGAPDSNLSGKPQPPSVNTSGVMVWPPYERDFAEYSNLYDSTAALAAGGNLGSMGAIGIGNPPTGDIGIGNPSFTLKLSSAELPQDNTLILRVFYATKHQLDSSGSTIPDVHRDIIVLGACAYAMEAYQIPTNDNFDFQDGALRDRVDDTKIPVAWLAAAKHKMQQFEARLEEIKEQRDYASSSRVHWGDIPARYPRL